MKLTLVRHTMVDVPKGICYGNTDVALAASFESEVIPIQEKLSAENFDAIFSSSLSRCTALAERLANNKNIRIDQRLKELNFGDWEMEHWNSFFESADGKAWFTDYVNTPCPNGESFAEQIRRTKSFLFDLKCTTFSNVLLVTHAGIIRATMSLLQDKTPEETFNTSLEYGQIVTFKLD